MLELKPLSKESIPKALVRAKHYRLLNEPWQAESICRDILNVDEDHQIAILYLILAITDQFGGQKRPAVSEARALCEKLHSEYEQVYYRGIISERMGKIALKRAIPRAKYIAYEHYEDAMRFFEKAQKIPPEGNQDAVLRWNACVRAIEEFKIVPAPDQDKRLSFLE